jgi:hypothetical protein
LHKVVDENKTTAFWIGGEANCRDKEVRLKSRSEEEFVVEFTFALTAEGCGVH